MENLDRCDKVVQQSSAKGISAIEIAEKLNVHRTTVHSYLNTLELAGKVYSEHGLWYPKETKGKERTLIQNYLIERFWREEEQIEKEYVEGNPFKAYEKANFLRLKLPEKHQKKLIPIFEEVAQEIRKISLKQGLTRIDDLEKPFKINRYLREVGIPILIEKISSILREMEKEGLSHE